MPPLETAVQTVAVPVAVAVVAVLLLLFKLPQTEERVDPGNADNSLGPAADPAGDHAKGASHIVEQGQRHESGLNYIDRYTIQTMHSIQCTLMYGMLRLLESIKL